MQSTPVAPTPALVGSTHQWVKNRAAHNEMKMAMDTDKDKDKEDKDNKDKNQQHH